MKEKHFVLKQNESIVITKIMEDHDLHLTIDLNRIEIERVSIPNRELDYVTLSWDDFEALF